MSSPISLPDLLILARETHGQVIANTLKQEALLSEIASLQAASVLLTEELSLNAEAGLEAGMTEIPTSAARASVDADMGGLQAQAVANENKAHELKEKLVIVYGEFLAITASWERVNSMMKEAEGGR